MGHIQTILVPVDGSPASLAGLCQAATLAEDLGASIEVLHVVGPEPFELGISASAKPTRETAEHDMDEAIRTVERRLHDRLEVRSVNGDPVQKILEVAAEDKPDLIVLGTHGRLGRLHALVGSVAEAVVRNAECPVLTVRWSDGEDESFSDKVHHRESIGERARSAR